MRRAFGVLGVLVVAAGFALAKGKSQLPAYVLQAHTTAVLIVVVRRGHGEVDETIRDPRQNNRPGDSTSTENTTTIGAQRGRQPDQAGRQGFGQQTAHPQMEIGPTEDLFTVFRGDVRDPLQGVQAWRCAAKDGLRPYGVSAVAEFKKEIAEAEKAAARKP